MISFADKYPELIKEWDKSNGKLSPYNISYGSNKKVMWKGRCGHNWEAVIKNRGKGHGCPICSGNKVYAGINDLETLLPGLADEWSERNYPLKPSCVTVNSTTKAWWHCKKCGHEWKALVSNRSRGSGCPECNRNVIREGVNDLTALCPEIIKDWSDKNIWPTPSIISTHSRHRVWWKCPKCGFEWQETVRVHARKQSCPVCSFEVLSTGKNDLAALYPEIAAEWDEVRNVKFSPDMVLPFSEKLVFWKDSHGHRWRSKIKERVLGAKCPYCKAEYQYNLKMKVIDYYSKELGLCVEYRKSRILGLPLEIFYPEINMAIVLTGLINKRINGVSSVNFTKSISEIAKNWMCVKAGIKLFRIIPYGQNEFENCACLMLQDETIECFMIAVKKIFKWVGITADIDICRDMEKIKNTELNIGEADDEEDNGKDNNSGTWNTTMAGNMLPGM